RRRTADVERRPIDARRRATAARRFRNRGARDRRQAPGASLGWRALRRRTRRRQSVGQALCRWRRALHFRRHDQRHERALRRRHQGPAPGGPLHTRRVAVQPMLSLFNKPIFVIGIPLIYAYIFLAWAVLVALMALVARPRGRDWLGFGR